MFNGFILKYWVRIPPAWRFAVGGIVLARLALTLWSLIIYSILPMAVQNLDLFGKPVLAVFDLRSSERHTFSRHVGDVNLTFHRARAGFLMDDQTGSLWSLDLGRAVEGRYTGQALDPSSFSPEKIFPYRGISPETNLLLALWQRFDTNWYLAIAERGYSDDGSSAFFPLYPLAIRLVGRVSGNEMFAALFISNLAMVGMLALLFQQTERLSDEASGRRAGVYLLIAPVGFFFLAAYTESLFLFLALLSITLAQRGRWLPASLIGVAAALSRLQGVLVFVPLTYLWWRSFGSAQNTTSKKILEGLTILLIPLTSATILFGLQSSFSALLEDYWRAKVSAPWSVLASAFEWLFTGAASLIDVLNLGSVLIAAVMLVFVWRKLPREYGLFMSAMLILPLIRLSPAQPFVSAMRYLLPSFPMFMMLGAWGRNPWVNRAIIYPSILLQLYLSAQFILWGFVG